MSNNIQVTLYHDTRKQSANDLYPVKLRIYHNGRERYYHTYMNNQKLYLSVEDFKGAYLSNRINKQYRDVNIAINYNITRAKDIIDSITPFSFDKFKQSYSGTKLNKEITVTSIYEDIIADKIKAEDIKTAGNYKSSISSITQFFSWQRKTDKPVIKVSDITVDKLKEYEDFLLNTEITKDGKVIKKKLSLTTVGFYLRPLRAVINIAISDYKVLERDNNPFGRERAKYKIPSSNKVNKALSKSQLQLLVNYDTTGKPYQEKAKDFFLLSLVCNGMNLKDILSLKYKSVGNRFFTFNRSKTLNTTKERIEVIQVPIIDYVVYMFNKYGNEDKHPDNYVFPVLNNDMTAYDKQRAIDNFIRYVNQHLKPISNDLQLPFKLTTYFARHTFSTLTVQSGKPLEYVQKALGHKNKRTTENYFSGFEDDTLHDNNNNLLGGFNPDSKQ